MVMDETLYIIASAVLVHDFNIRKSFKSLKEHMLPTKYHITT